MPSTTRRRRAPARRGRPAGARRGRAARRTPPGAAQRLLGWTIALGAGLVVVLVASIGLSAGASDFGTRLAGAVSGVTRANGTTGSGTAGSDSGSANSGVTCPAAAPKQVGSVSVPAGPVAGYCQDRLVNAAHIINAARALGIGTRTQAIGVMTAMGESSLVNVDHGDTAGPDSRGLFQQRDNGAWGTYSDRMTPFIAATHFFEKTVRVPGWKTMTPTLLAHTVQVNSDPYHYESYWPSAVAVVEALSGPVPQ